MVLVFFRFASCLLFISYFVTSCPLLVSPTFICYLTYKDLGHMRFYCTGYGACFFLLSFLSSFYFLFCSFLSSSGFSPLHLLFNKQGLRAQEVPLYWLWCLYWFLFSFLSSFYFWFCSFFSSFGLSPLHLLFNKQGLRA